MPREVALKAWALTHGALPGVSAGAADRSVPPCGLPAERWVRAHWASLSEARSRRGSAASGERTSAPSGAYACHDVIERVVIRPLGEEVPRAVLLALPVGLLLVPGWVGLLNLVR